MSLNVIKYQWDVGENIKGQANAIKNLNFNVWLGKNDRNRHVDIELFELWDKEETKVISEELDLKQLVCLRNFLNSIPFLDEELGEKDD